MERRTFVRNGTVLFGSSLLPIHFLNNLLGYCADYQIKLLRENVYIFSENGGTIAFNTSESGITVVDSQFPEQAAHLIAAIQKDYINPIDLLINTHHHRDHTAGNIAFKNLAKKVVAHENSKKNQILSAEEDGNVDQQLFPDEIFKENWSARVGNENIIAKYFGAAHTNGDAVIHFENANIAHIGDLVFNRRFPYIDKPKGANIQNWIKVLDEILSYYNKDTIFVFGHAGENYPVTGKKEDIISMRNYLDALLVFMKNKIAEGNPLEQLLKEVKFIPGAEEWQGSGIERSINAAWEEIVEPGGGSREP